MRPSIELLTIDTISEILDEAFQILMNPGVKIQDPEARDLLGGAGAQVFDEIVHIPEKIIRQVLTTVPSEFWLYNQAGEPVVHYGGDDVHFDPGSSGVHILDSDTQEHRPSTTKDLIRIVKIAEVLPAFDAQSTAVVCNEIPKAIGDLYRLFIVLQLSSKPVVTGAFSAENLNLMIDMLAICTGSHEILAEKPRAIFDVCPSPPLTWTNFGAQNLIRLARSRTPAELISMPLAGAASPVTIIGSVVQHAAETLSGLAIHQLAYPGAPFVWGGAPAVFDMRWGTTPMGAVETAMIDIAYAQVGKSLRLPTHTYLGASDSKIVDTQAGFESAMSGMLGALAGINMISGAGMLDYLACQSVEKLIIDAEWIGMTKRLLKGVNTGGKPFATGYYADFMFKADFLRHRNTKELFKQEQYLPSPVIDRDSLRGWQEKDGLDTFQRARMQSGQLLKGYVFPDKDPAKKKELEKYTEMIARKNGLNKLPSDVEYLE